MAESKWQRVTKRRPCIYCDHPDWCTYTIDGAACCMRAESDRPMGNGGWLHMVDGAEPVTPKYEPPPPTKYYVDVSAQWERACTAMGQTNRLAVLIDVPVPALRAFHVGWDGRAWTFPMYDLTFQPIGFRRRFPDGKKLSMKGGHEGLFVPTSIQPDRLVICEGPTDAAALWGIGCQAVGRPSNVGGYALLCGLLKLWRPARLTIVADRDETGSMADKNTLRGARKLLDFAESIRMEAAIRRPPLKIKDARDWVRAGATLRDIIGG